MKSFLILAALLFTGTALADYESDLAEYYEARDEECAVLLKAAVFVRRGTLNGETQEIMNWFNQNYPGSRKHATVFDWGFQFAVDERTEEELRTAFIEACTSVFGGADEMAGPGNR